MVLNPEHHNIPRISFEIPGCCGMDTRGISAPKNNSPTLEHEILINVFVRAEVFFDTYKGQTDCSL